MAAKQQASFVIMLDDWIDVFIAHWPMSGRTASLAAARAIASHSGRNPTLVPKQSARAELIEAKNLRNDRTGAIDKGGIYRLVTGGAS